MTIGGFLGQLLIAIIGGALIGTVAAVLVDALKNRGFFWNA